MIILGIETSCDETAAAVVQDGRRVLSNVIASQTQLHAPFGGVVPELAARQHIESIEYIVNRALEDAGVTLAEIDGYAVANGPGLAGALLVGLNYAKGLAYANNKPLVGVHHIEGHVCANYIGSGLEPPFLCLVVSGGHTVILSVDDYDTYRVLGSTRDDAAGEAFDKVARLLGLPYPGGPQIDKLAKVGNSDAYPFPRAKVDGYDFSFSGLKTAARDVIMRVAKHEEGQKHEQASKQAKVDETVQISLKGQNDTFFLRSSTLADIAASFQQSVVDSLVTKTLAACQQLGYSQVAMAGGVACNYGLRVAMQAACDANNIPLYMPKPIYCTDNAAMIATRGYYSLVAGKSDGFELNAFPGRMV